MTTTNKSLTWADFTVFTLTSIALLFGMAYLDEPDTFSFRWFIHPAVITLILMYVVPVFFFQFIASKLLPKNELRFVRTILSSVIGLTAGFFFYMLLAAL